MNNMMQRPYILADIPQDLTGSIGRVLTANVYGLRGSSFRKRPEIAIAIDRQVINIYNVGTLCTDILYLVLPAL